MSKAIALILEDRREVRSNCTYWDSCGTGLAEILGECQLQMGNDVSSTTGLGIWTATWSLGAASAYRGMKS